MDKTISSIIVISMISLTASADTFVHRSTHEKLHGYATSKTENGKTIVQTQEKGQVPLNLAQYIIFPDPQGRNNSIAISLLTLPAADAVKCGIVDKIVDSRDQILFAQLAGRPIQQH